ncbi:hypothetical protein [Actinospica robiniae]|uniref:hypothetical protein n=1 Tax=Actinospica robiniae TaxID=304901 RepID=UPI00040FF21D|nr:hypothetical protein [Actinospica robiniae]
MPRGLPGTPGPPSGTLDSCVSCYAWGLIHSTGVCLGCYNFTAPARRHPIGRCGACRREQPLKNGYCRLCWCQARHERDGAQHLDARAKVMIAPHLPLVRHQQLFLAGMTKRTARPRTAPRRRGEKGRPRKPPPPVAARPAARWIQTALFELDRRNYRAQRLDLRSAPAPENPFLAWALHLAHTTAQARGWNPASQRAMQRTLTELLATHQAGETVRASAARPVARAHCIGLEHVLELLEQMDVLDDDLPTTFDMWLAAKAATLAPAIGADITAWARTLRYGTPRSPARHPHTAYTYLTAILPALTAWSARYHHLREVTPAMSPPSTTGPPGSSAACSFPASARCFAGRRPPAASSRTPPAPCAARARTAPSGNPWTKPHSTRRSPPARAHRPASFSHSPRSTAHAPDRPGRCALTTSTFPPGASRSAASSAPSTR